MVSARWSSPEDVVGIVILLVIFPFLALDLFRTRGYRGCALSAAWCVTTYNDPDPEFEGLPEGTWLSRVIAVIGTVCALACRVWSLYKFQFNRTDVPELKVLFAIGSLLLSHLAMVSCALVPMSCDCLHDGVEWVYISWRDYVHDGSLATIYISSILSGCLCGYMHVPRKRILLLLTIVTAILQTIGIYQCPTAQNSERFLLLILEVIALALAQFLHYGTLRHLITKVRSSQHGEKG